MKLFSYDKKTGRFEYHLTDRLNEIHIRALKAISHHKYLNHEGESAVFAEDAPGKDRQEKEDNVYQISHDVMSHLTYLGFVEWEMNKAISDWDEATKNYINDRKVSGYFLTENGKAFIDSLEPKHKRK